MKGLCSIHTTYQGQALRVASQTLTSCVDYADANHEINGANRHAEGYSGREVVSFHLRPRQLN